MWCTPWRQEESKLVYILSGVSLCFTGFHLSLGVKYNERYVRRISVLLLLETLACIAVCSGCGIYILNNQRYVKDGDFEDPLQAFQKMPALSKIVRGRY